MIFTAVTLTLATILLGSSAYTLEEKRELKDSSPLIYNGELVPQGGLPFMVVIFIQMYEEKTVTCGGSILSPTKILTAAHCFDHFGQHTPHFAGVGYGDLETGDKAPGAQLIRIKSFEAPTEYIKGVPAREIVGDIAIATLEKPITMSATVKTVPLGGQSKAQLMGKTGSVSGWGYYSEETLKKADGQTVAKDDYDYCKQLTRGYGIPSTVMCVTNDGKESCKGDSGGPFMVEGKQEGIISWGPTCRHGLPGFYTVLGPYLSWVKARV